MFSKSSIVTFLFTASLAATVAWADTRSDAMSVLARLREEGVATRSPEEMRSLDATLATAELYYQLNDMRNAERYYQLAIQKGAVIRQHLVGVAPASPEKATAPIPSPRSPAPAVQPPFSSPSLPASPPSTNISAPPADTPSASYTSSQLVGRIGSYTVTRGDTLRLIAAKLGVSRTQLAAMNGLSVKDKLRPGQQLRYNNRRIIPAHHIRDGLVINIPDRTLYLFEKGGLAFSTAVALGTPTKTEQFVWQTPIGKFKIVNKAKDPTWTVPPSIQEEMRLEGKEVITSIPPGKDNPLGKYAMKTSLPGILIHSTTKPWSIYSYASHGCIRVYPERMEELFKLVKVNTNGEIIYHPVKLTVTDEGKVLLEAHGDIYNRTKGLEAEAKRLIKAQKLDDRIDWAKVKRVLSRKSGVAEEITRDSYEAGKPPVTAQNNHSPS